MPQLCTKRNVGQHAEKFGVSASDNREHLLLYCPALDRKRTELTLTLMSGSESHHINSSSMLQFLLGNIQCNNRKSKQNHYALQQSARPIESIYSSRFRRD